MGDERSAYPLTGDTAHAQRPRTGVRASGVVSIPLSLHHIHPRHVHTARWEEDFQQTQRYYNTMLGHYGAAPATATPELCEEVVRKHLQSNSILAILSLQDWMSMDGKWRNPNAQEERINVPANPRHYWRWRMHLTLEQLMKAESLNEKIKELIAQNGR